MKQADRNTKKFGSKTRLFESLKKSYERFLKIRGNPHEIAMGMACGLFIGMTPTVGIQMAVAVFVAALFKYNKLSAAMGVWISNPFTVIPIYTFTYQFGAMMLGIHTSVGPPVDFSVKMLLKVPELFLISTLGGMVVGIPIAIIGYYFSYNAIKKYQDDIKRKLEARKTKIKQLKKNAPSKKRKKKKK